MLRSTRSSSVAQTRGRSIEAQTSTPKTTAPAITGTGKPRVAVDDADDDHGGRPATSASTPHDAAARRPEPLDRLLRRIVLLPVAASPSWIAVHRAAQPYAGPVTSTPTTAMPTGQGSRAAGARHGLLRHHPVRRLAAPVPARPARRRPGRRRGPRRRARHPLDQDHGQGVRDRPRDPDGRPDHARGPGHPRQGPRARRQGDAPRPGRPDLPDRPPPCASTPTWSRPPRRCSATAACNVAAVATAFPSGRAALDIKLADTRDAVEAGADEIDMVIDRGAFLSGRYLRGLRRDRRGPRGLRPPGRQQRPPQGDLRDRRAADLRQRPPRQLAGDDGRRPLHQDLHRQGAARRDAAGHAGHARGGPRLPRGRPARWSA